MSSSSTLRSSKYWIDIYLAKILPGKIFQTINVPSDDAWGNLMTVMKKILIENEEIGAVNIYNRTKDHNLTGMYMQVCDEMEKISNDLIKQREYDENHPENIAAEVKRQTILKMLEDIKRSQK